MLACLSRVWYGVGMTQSVQNRLRSVSSVQFACLTGSAASSFSSVRSTGAKCLRPVRSVQLNSSSSVHDLFRHWFTNYSIIFLRISMYQMLCEHWWWSTELPITAWGSYLPAGDRPRRLFWHLSTYLKSQVCHEILEYMKYSRLHLHKYYLDGLKLLKQMCDSTSP